MRHLGCRSPWDTIPFLSLSVYCVNKCLITRSHFSGLLPDVSSCNSARTLVKSSLRTFLQLSPKSSYSISSSLDMSKSGIRRAPRPRDDLLLLFDAERRFTGGRRGDPEVEVCLPPRLPLCVGFFCLEAAFSFLRLNSLSMSWDDGINPSA